MDLNKINRYCIAGGESYTHVKNTFTEALTGFDGISFESVEATEDSGEEFVIYLNSEKSIKIRITQNISLANRVDFAVLFRDSEIYKSTAPTVNNGWCVYNIARTDYGVAFTDIGYRFGQELISDDTKIVNFFSTGTPNVFVRTNSTSNLNNNAIDYWLSELHETVENDVVYSALCTSAVTRTALQSACSKHQPIECEHLYRLVFSDGKVGKIKIDDKYFILGCRYALECSP